MKKIALAVIVLLLVFVFSSGVCFASSEAISPFNGITWDADLKDLVSIGIRQGYPEDGYIMFYDNDVRTNVAGFDGLSVYYFTEDTLVLEKIDILIHTGVDERGDNIFFIFKDILEYLESYYNVEADRTIGLVSSDALKYVSKDDATIGKAINDGKLTCEGTLQTKSSNIRLYSVMIADSMIADSPTVGLCLNYVRADNTTSEEIETKADLTTSNFSTPIAPSTTVTWDAEDIESMSMEELTQLHHRITEEIKVRTIGDMVSPEDDLLYVANDTEVYIRAYLGAGGRVVIPSEIDGKPVTQISSKAFRQIKGITELVLPEGLKRIEDECFLFSDIPMEGTLVLPTTLEYVGNQACINAFTGINGIVIQSDCCFDGVQSMAWLDKVQFIYIAENAKAILGSAVFQDYDALTIAVIPSSVTQISDSAFMDCPRLTIYTPEGSYAEEYAKRMMIPCNTEKYEEMNTYYASLYLD